MITKPTIVQQQLNDDGWHLTLHLPAQLHYFNGHFPQQPILAGVVQLDWAIDFARHYLTLSDDEVSSVEVLKFQQLILPDTTIELVLTQKDTNKFTFTYSSQAGAHASGRVKIGG